MKRKIINIDENKCNGCGLCIPDCPEGALKLVDGKARLTSDFFCDGLGACIGTCPEGAITVIEREAEVYDEAKVMGNIVRQGVPAIQAHLEHLLEHGETELYNKAIEYLNNNKIDIPKHNTGSDHAHKDSCQDSKVRTIERADSNATNINKVDIASELRQWPVQKERNPLKLADLHRQNTEQRD